MKLNDKTAIEHYGFNRSLQEKARKYHYEKLLMSLFQYGFLFMAGFVTLKAGISHGLKIVVLGYASDSSLVVALYFFIGFLFFWLITLPFDYYKGYVIERKFDLSTQSFRSWISDQVKMLILRMVLLMFIVQGVYFALRMFAPYWWIITWIFVSGGMVVVSYIAPVVIMPLFFKYPPLKETSLIGRLTNLAKKAGIRVVGVFEMKAGVKTKKAVGALAGIGNTRRIILSDTLLTNYTHDEIEGVIGHELGHHVFHHIGKMLIMFSVMMLVAFYVIDLVLRASVSYFGFSGIDDIASLPLLALTLAMMFMVATPIMNTLSRYAEGQADQYELEIVNNPDAFITCMVKLCDQNLRHADPHPLIEFMLYDHPSGKHRVQRALNYKKTQNVQILGIQPRH